MSAPGLLIAGGSGLLGRSWTRAVKGNFNIFSLIHERSIEDEGVSFFKVNCQSTDSISTAIDHSGAKLLINCIAMTNIEACQAKPADAYFANVKVPENLAIACAEKNIKLVHISTDHIFSGKNQKSTEDDFPHPLNVYAASKLEAEEIVTRICPSALIVRTNFFGWGFPYRQSFSDSILRALNSGNTIQLFSDVFFTPILMQTLIKVVHELIDLNASGVFHVVGDERISKFEFGRLLAETFQLDNEYIKQDLLSRRTDLVPRPLDLSLSNDKMKSFIGYKMPSLEVQIREMQLQDGLKFLFNK